MLVLIHVNQRYWNSHCNLFEQFEAGLTEGDRSQRR